MAIMAAGLFSFHDLRANEIGNFSTEHFECAGNRSTVFLPDSAREKNELLPVIVFGHGWLHTLTHYESTFAELARHRIAIVFPESEDNIFYPDHARLVKLFLNSTACAMARYKSIFDTNHITFAGHSLGAKVAALAAASMLDSSVIRPQGLFLLEPSLNGDDAAFAQQFRKISTKISVAIVYAVGDNVAPLKESKLIYDLTPSPQKELLILQNQTVDHFWPVTNYFMVRWGGLVGPLHRAYLWPWLMDMAHNVRPTVKAGMEVQGVNISVLKPSGWN
jgi:pimeloyl-ACP methyl ester carboxylesterase